MVSTTKSSSNHHSPTSVPSSAPSGYINSPNFLPKTLLSPWATVVRGGETESTTGIHQSLPSSSSSSSSSLAADQTPPSDHSPKAVSALPPVDNSNTPDSSDGSDGIAGRSKKPAWNRHSNGVVEAGPLMGAESWPALSASTKASGKLPAESSSKSSADGSLSTSKGPVTSHSPQKQGTSSAKSNSSTNYNMPNRQRPMRRVGGNNIGSGPAQSSFSNPPPSPPPPPFSVYQLPPVSYGNVAPGRPNPSSRDQYRNNSWDIRPLVGGFVPAMNEQQGSSRRGNFGPHPRDGSYYNNYGSRRDQDRRNYVNIRDAHVPQPRMPPRGILRHPPPSTAVFVGPQPIGHFPNPTEFYYIPTVTLESFRGMPFIPHNPSPATFFPPIESPLSNMIVYQVDYYFSDTNLVKDGFLRSNMDEQGWVPVALIANFPKVKILTSNIQLILDSLRTSTVVEVQGDKLRRRNEWMRWLPNSQLWADSGSLSPIGSRLAADFQTITLEETIKDEGSRQSQLRNGGDAAANNN